MEGVQVVRVIESIIVVIQIRIVTGPVPVRVLALLLVVRKEVNLVRHPVTVRILRTRSEIDPDDPGQSHSNKEDNQYHGQSFCCASLGPNLGNRSHGDSGRITEGAVFDGPDLTGLPLHGA